MPRFVYICDCGKSIAEIRSIEERDQEKDCPSCKSENGLKRKLSTPSLNIQEGSKERSLEYRFGKAIDNAKQTRYGHVEKFGKYSEYVKDHRSIEVKAEEADVEPTTYHGNVSKQQMDETTEEELKE